MQRMTSIQELRTRGTPRTQRVTMIGVAAVVVLRFTSLPRHLFKSYNLLIPRLGLW